MTPGWLVPARSIPVWVGARLCDDSSTVVTVIGIDVCGGDPTDYDSLRVYRIPHGIMCVDLSNPDTFAAARDRLALRWFTPDDVSGGVTLYRPCCAEYWLLGVAFSDVDPVKLPIEDDVRSRELALALAWRAVAQ